ncbi:MAG: pyridoxal phosphate-dependent aminotransferase [Candidatus Omnitrophota bacterium]|nr:pyridoxal phosphate-dependent aminotransferase [Candidatus Omnitrophota bacterium]
MLSERIRAVHPSPTLRFTALARELQSQGKKVVNLAAGEPDFDTPEPIKAAAIRAIQEGFTKYTPSSGIPELKAAIVSTLARDRGLAYRPEQVMVTCGAKQALFNLFQVLVQPGDEVLVPSPYWVSYPEMVRLAGATPVEVRTEPSDKFRLSAEAVSKACTPKTRCLILNSPSNPTGAVLGEQSLKEIARVAQAKGLWIISDEIYSQLVYGGKAPSIAAVAPEVAPKTLVVDGVSKAYAMTGWRIGYMAGPAEVVEAAGRLQDHSTSNPASISQKAALAALTGDPASVREMAREFGRRRDLLVRRLAGIPGISFVEPEGAFYCFVDISKSGLKSSVFSERLLQEALVASIPGDGFGWDHYVRLSFAVGSEALEEGMNRFQKFIGSLIS